MPTHNKQVPDILGQLEANLAPRKVSIVEFAQSKEFCNRVLYPRQKLLLKLIHLEDLTDQEETILDYWIKGGRGGNEIQISPYIRERREYLKANGYPHFREIVLVGGRRCSKGFITGLCIAKKIYNLIQLNDPNKHYGIDADKEIYFSCVAAALEQASDQQYADVAGMVNSCKALQRHIFKVQEHEFSLMTEKNLRQMAEWKRNGRRVQRDISTIRGKALPANARTIRGSATMTYVFDEFAHFLQGDSDQADSEVYASAVPSLAQFGRDAQIWCNPPEAPMWMSDLSFKPIGDIKPGEKVMGWNKPDGKVHRELCESEVLNVLKHEAPIVKVTMESGRTFRCTADHKWLTLSSGGNRNTHDGEWYAPAKVGRKLAHVIDPTPELDPSLAWDAAWLGGMFDGEGHTGRARQLSIAQSREKNLGVCLQIEKSLTKLGFTWKYHRNHKTKDKGTYHILGSNQETTNFANWTHPIRIHQLKEKVMAGRFRSEDRVVSIEPDGYGEVVALTTTTGNYVCNGYASKNCNSSPYSKVGMFFERYEEAMASDNAGPANPLVMGIRLPSWALYEGWWDDNSYVGLKKCVTVSPDWDYTLKKDDGELFYSEDDRQGIMAERYNEQEKPDKYKVERRGQFAEVIDSYLNPESVDRMFAGKPDEKGRPVPLFTNRVNASNSTRYKMHLDPSSTTAGFAMAMAHVEQLEVNNVIQEHVVFDIIKRWEPKDFPGGVIDWQPILDDMIYLIDIFRPHEVSMDLFNSDYPISWLNRELRRRNIGETRVYQKAPNIQSNWDRAEIFKTALYRNLIHAPNDIPDCLYAADELKFLQQINTARVPRVEHQTAGAVQTKDCADAIMECVEDLIGNSIARDVRLGLAGGPALGAQGGYQIGGAAGGSDHALSHFYHQRGGEQRFSGRSSSNKPNPTRRTAGGKPIPRKLPGW